MLVGTAAVSPNTNGENASPSQCKVDIRGSDTVEWGEATMAVWLTLSAALLMVGLLAYLLWRVRQGMRRFAKEWHEVLAQLDEGTAAVEAQIAQLRQHLKDLEPTPSTEPLWLGAFLPTDAHAAMLERQVRESEDHAISSAGPIRYSSRPSATSGRGSAREPSTQRPKGSGRP